MRIATAQLSPATLEQMPRTTRWRALKRGWIRLVPERDADRSLIKADYHQLLKEAKIAARVFSLAEFPCWIGYEDLIQECFYAVLRQSGRQEVDDPGWRVKVMRNRLRDLRRVRQGEVG